MLLDINEVQDEAGRRYCLSNKSWQGGQGIVYLDQTGKFLIKVNSKDPLVRDRIRQQIRRVRQMPINDLPITRPLELLRPPYAGYVMEYLTEMEPIKNLSWPPKGLDFVTWHIDTGGLKRRLLLLAKCAEVIYKLHSKGIIYGDLSPNNVFVSAAVDHNQVYLIDVDNLTYETNTSTSMIFTRFYGAPEVFKQERGVDSLTDAHSFAVIAFEVLALGHPLIGDMVASGEPQLEDRALAGEFPWIFHCSDVRNVSSHVLPKEIFFSPRLFELCQKTFEDGLTDRKKRPGIWDWVEKLYTAAQFVLVCPNCHASYYRDQEHCPWCKATLPDYMMIVVDVYTVNSDNSLVCVKKAITGCCLEHNQPLQLTRRMIGYGGENADHRILEIEEIDQRIRVHSLDEGEYWITAPDWSLEKGFEQGRKEKIRRDRKSFSPRWQIHLGNIDKPHSVLRFFLNKG